jgi:hypothetical protein
VNPRTIPGRSAASVPDHFAAPEEFPLLDKVTAADRLDCRSISSRVLRHWPILFHMLVDFHGRPLAAVQRLGNPDLVVDPGKRRPDGPKLVMLRGPSPLDGSWLNIGPPSAQGDDVIDLVAWLGSCDRHTAAAFLAGLVNRIAVVEAA